MSDLIRRGAAAALACCLCLLLSLPSPRVFAQELLLEEVIVTARKRAESLQATPVAVTALDAQALQAAGVHNLADLNQVAPNIEVSSANGNAPLANIFIRGVGQRNTGVNIDSGVGIYIDGVYVGRPDGALLDVVDIQSVQVLRGPQGTLFGKNTTGGALVFTTNRPRDEFAASLGARIGNYARLDGDGMVNLPLTDSMWTRLSGTYRSRDGFIRNTFDGKDYMDEDRQSLIWQTRWVPSQSLTLDLNVNWAKTDQLARPLKCVPVPGKDGWQSTLFDALAIVPATGRTYDDFCQDSADAGGGDKLTLVSDLGGRYRAENKGASLTLSWDINDRFMFKSISAWRYTEASQDDELDHTGVPLLHRTNNVHPVYNAPRETDQYSQELQLNGSFFNERLQTVTGLYWFSEKTDGGDQVSYLGPFDPAIANLFFINSTNTRLDTDNSAMAIFAQAEWAFDDNWRATLGLRYTDEKRELARRLLDVDPATLDLSGGAAVPVGGGLYVVQRPGFTFNPAFGFVERDRIKQDTSDSDTSPMASVQYLIDNVDWIDEGSAYLTYSRGFLSGGLSEAPSGKLETYEPEKVESWELGLKLDLMNRRLRVNTALFYADYTNRQLTTVVISPETGNPAGATINAKATTIAGYELETTWLASQNLLLTFNITINDGDIDKYDDVQLSLGGGTQPPAGCSRQDLTVVKVDACPNDRSDEHLPRLPKQSYLLAAQYSVDLAAGSLVSRFQASLKTDLEYCFDSGSCRSGLWFEDEQFDLSARVSWISHDENWSAAIYGTNLTDEDYLVGGTALVDSSGVGGYAVATPRMYGAELQYHF